MLHGLPLSQSELDAVDKPACDVHECKDHASKLVWMPDIAGTKGDGKLFRYCEGHAYLFIGRWFTGDATRCPNCGVIHETILDPAIRPR